MKKLNKKLKQLKEALFDARRCGDADDARDLSRAIEAEEAILDVDEGMRMDDLPTVGLLFRNPWSERCSR